MDKRQEELTRLGFAGVIPFIGGAVLVWVLPLLGSYAEAIAMNIHTVVLAYGGIIAGYMAGAGAGAIIASPVKTQERLLPGMIAALIAWFAIMPNGFLMFSIGAAWRHGLIIFVLIYLLLRDLRAVDNNQLPSWYGNLRVRLTLWACIGLLFIAIRLALMGQY